MQLKNIPYLYFQHFQRHSNPAALQIGQQADQLHLRRLKQKHALRSLESLLRRNQHKQSILACLWAKGKQETEWLRNQTANQQSHTDKLNMIKKLIKNNNNLESNDGQVPLEQVIQLVKNAKVICNG